MQCIIKGLSLHFCAQAAQTTEWNLLCMIVLQGGITIAKFADKPLLIFQIAT